MPWYNDLRPEDDESKQDYALVFPGMTDAEKKRTIENLLRLRSGLDQDIPQKITEQNLLIATWNLKEFGHLKNRLPETYFYIAEILNRFDLIAIQEVKSTLTDLDIIMRLLGSKWAYLIADITEGEAGNSERFAYVYDTERVRPSGLAGEIVLWDEITAGSAIKQLKRTPYITGFQAGWKSFAIINIHLQPKKEAEFKAKRKEEARLLLKALTFKLQDKRLWSDNLMIMGDTNLYKTDADIVGLFTENDFNEIVDLKDKLTNVAQTEIYDRIFIHNTEYFALYHNFGRTGDVLKYFDYVYRLEDFQVYRGIMHDQKLDPSTLVDDEAYAKYFKNTWRGNQMSDHYPVWIQLKIDSTDLFLKNKLARF